MKVTESLALDHRAQLINYLLLSKLSRGKLVNVYPELIEHEFVNVLTTVGQRTDFAILSRA